VNNLVNLVNVTGQYGGANQRGYVLELVQQRLREHREHFPDMGRCI
jgi:hypothetical protein